MQRSREYARRIGKHNSFIFREIVADDETLQRYIGRNSRIEGTIERFRYSPRRYRRLLHRNPFPEQAILALGYLLTSQGVPCLYYGTEQGFDRGGDNDSFVRECMFGGQWGAFDSRKRHFFRPAHPIYKAIARIAAVRQGQAALRYGRQYFREISGNGKDFGFPIDGRCTLAFSRILDTREILVALNLDSPPRQDFITLDANLSAADGILSNLLSPESNFTVEKRGERHAVQVPLAAYGMAILGKRKIAAC